MNVSLTNVDSVNGILEVKIAKEDYQGKVDAAIKEYRKKAQIPGFRQGNAPLAMVKKMVGKSILVDEINKMASEAVYNYITENNVSVLGEPLPNQEKQKEINFDTDEEFDFFFDLAWSPEINLPLTNEDHLTYYKIEVEQKFVDEQIESIRNNYGAYKTLDEDAKITDMIKGRIVEVENGQAKVDGIEVKAAVLMPSYMKDEEEQNKFVGCKVGDVVTFNPGKAYDGNVSELASLLQISKEEVETLPAEFNFEVASISRYEKAELNQELFDKAFGKGNVTNEAEFMDKVKAMIQKELDVNSDYKFVLDASEFLMNKVGQLEFPTAFLKRWLLVANEKSTPEQLELEYPKIEEDLKFHLIKGKIAKDSAIQVASEDIQKAAIEAARAQFAQYGMNTLPDDMLANYAETLLKESKTANSIYEKALETKVIGKVKDLITIDEVAISLDEFKKFFQKEEQAAVTEIED